LDLRGFFLCVSHDCRKVWGMSEELVALDGSECPICYRLMNNFDMKPMVLSPCGHTFCKNCLDQLYLKRCSICRLTYTNCIPNRSLMEMIDSWKRLRRSSPYRRRGSPYLWMRLVAVLPVKRAWNWLRYVSWKIRNHLSGILTSFFSVS
jgi:hypothetical protein